MTIELVWHMIARKAALLNMWYIYVVLTNLQTSVAKFPNIPYPHTIRSLPITPIGILYFFGGHLTSASARNFRCGECLVVASLWQSDTKKHYFYKFNCQFLYQSIRLKICFSVSLGNDTTTNTVLILFTTILIGSSTFFLSPLRSTMLEYYFVVTNLGH